MLNEPPIDPWDVMYFVKQVDTLGWTGIVLAVTAVQCWVRDIIMDGVRFRDRYGR